MTPSFWQIAIVLVLIVLLFGRGKISDLMGDVARGIKSFKKGMNDDDTVATAPPGVTQAESIDSKTADTVAGKDKAAKS